MVTPTAYDPEFQDSINGPLTPAAINRILAVQAASRLTLVQLGTKFGVSGSFLGNLLRRYEYNGHIAALRTSKHADRVKAALATLEKTYGLGKAETSDKPAPSSAPIAKSRAADTLDALVMAIHDRGFAVTLTPLTIPLH